MNTIDCAVEGCGGKAVPTQKDGRFYIHRSNNVDYPQVFINVPPSFVIPKCNRCGMDMFTDELYKALLQVLEVEYQLHADLIKAIVAKHGAKVKAQ